MPHKNYISVNKNHVEITKNRNKYSGHHIPLVMGGKIDYTLQQNVNSPTFGLYLGGSLNKMEALHFGKKRAEKNNANIQFIV